MAQKATIMDRADKSPIGSIDGCQTAAGNSACRTRAEAEDADVMRTVRLLLPASLSGAVSHNSEEGRCLHWRRASPPTVEGLNAVAAMTKAATENRKARKESRAMVAVVENCIDEMDILLCYPHTRARRRRVSTRVIKNSEIAAATSMIIRSTMHTI